MFGVIGSVRLLDFCFTVSRPIIDISISYDPACDEVYHWAISDYPVDEFSYSNSFWNSVIAYAENHFEDSDLVLFTTTIYDTSDSSVDASLSSESNLR